ncbi:hypothetical protein Msub_12758 [Marinobacter subterrani]|uniref:Uncharacterized protein n=2 Tax=Marinobacter subterrani TaxID=1658765 RepID=A0A0J7JF59_9GAMM|nr:hypothetical protein Msub_12758 [Marinobacter subterrani]
MFNYCNNRISDGRDAVDSDLTIRKTTVHALASAILAFGLTELTLPHLLVIQGLVLSVFAILFWLTLPMIRSVRAACCEAQPLTSHFLQMLCYRLLPVQSATVKG